ncbi:MAG TPA: hypothetical protein VFZ66_14965 [Herpetosiphonaceae bacterium]
MLSARSSLAGFLIGIVCIGIAITAVLTLSSTVTLTCGRALQNSQCELKSTGPLNNYARQFRLADLTGATVEKEAQLLPSRRSRTSRYRIVLQTRSGPMPLTSGYSSRYDQKRRTAEEITAFVKNRSAAVLKIKQSDGWLGYIVGLGFGTLGLMLMSRKTRGLFGFGG